MLQGLVQAVGISNYGPKQMERIHKYLEKRGVPLAAAQVQYSLLSRGPQQEQIRAVCRDLGVQMIAYSPLALGMLSGEVLHWCRCCVVSCVLAPVWLLFEAFSTSSSDLSEFGVLRFIISAAAATAVAIL